MNFRQRLITSALWLAVALVMAVTLDLGVPSTANEAARAFVVVVALLLAAIYLLDPNGLVSQKPFPDDDDLFE